MVQQRNIATSVVLSFITCGIYAIFWMISLTDDMRALSNDQELSGGKAVLYTIITCGIYRYFWSYKMGKAIYQAKTSRGITDQDNSTLYLILSIFSLDIVNYCLFQNEINNMATKTTVTQ